jgi:hypothetical protein
MASDPQGFGAFFMGRVLLTRTPPGGDPWHIIIATSAVIIYANNKALMS